MAEHSTQYYFFSLEITLMTQKVTHKAAAKNVTESQTAMAGIKKGAIAAKIAATNVVLMPAKLLDKAVYGTCYGLSYGAVFTSLVVAKMLPSSSVAMKGFHGGAVEARKDFVAIEHDVKATIDSTLVK
jgi:hypothetical protein